MTRNRALLASTAIQLALVALPGVALAQASPTPPENYTLDARGVDLVEGTFVYQADEVAIGPAEGGLVHSRVYVGNGWRDTLSGTIAVSGSVYRVSLGAQTEVFVKSGSTFTPASNRGATLSQTGSQITFRTSDGTVATYSTTYSGSTTMYAANNAALTKVVKPNGETIDFDLAGYTYCASYLNIDEEGNRYNCGQYRNAIRIDAIRNNLGYRINYEYAANTIDDQLGGPQEWLTRVKVTGVNQAVEYCDAYTACSSPWPSVTYQADYTGAETVTDQGGRVTTYTNANGLSGVRYPGSTSDDIIITRGANGRVSGVTDASGAWTYAITDSGTTRTTTASGPLNQSVTAVANLTIGRATSVTQATAPGVSRTWTYGYDSQHRLQRVTNPEGDYAEVTYDTRGNVTQTRSVGKAGSGSTDIITSATYPTSCTSAVTCNLPTSTTDARGYTTDYTYDSTHGGVLTVTAPAPSTGAVRPQTRVSYAAQTAYYKTYGGTLVAAPTSVTLPVQVSACATGSSCIGTADEVRTTLTYGSAGVANNLSPMTVSRGSGASPSLAVAAMTHTAVGDVATVDGPLPGGDDTTRYIYDDARRNVGVIGPDPDGGGSLSNRAERMTYSPRGQVTQSQTGTTAGQSDLAWSGFSPLVTVNNTYDSYGRPILAEQASGGVAPISQQQWSYDAAGRVSCATVRMTLDYTVPTNACTPEPAGAFGPDRISQVAYDHAGRATHVTTAAGLAEAVTQVTAYTSNGRVASLTDGNGNVSIVEYDIHDRPVRLRYPSDASAGTTSTSDYEEIGYDPSGNVVTHRNRAGQATAVNYDNLRRPTYIDAPSGTMDVAMTYDNLGRVITSSGSGQTLNKAWDPLSRLVSESGPLGDTGYQYNAAGRVTRITWPDAFYAQYDYDVSGAVIAIRENGATSGAGVLATYTYTNLGQPSTIARGNGISTSYGYDNYGRMTSLSHGGAANVTFSFGYNPAGQIASRTVSNPAYVLAPGPGTTSYGNDGLNRVTSVAGTGVGYDGNQNISSALGSSYSYDQANRLTSAIIGGTTYAFSYDPANRLYSNSSGERFLYSGQQLVGEYGTSGALQTRHIPGPGLDMPVASLFSGGLRYQQLADERGSVVALTDASAAVAGVNRYDEYGVASASDRFQYTGQAYLAPGLYHYRARTYAPQLGRFLQTDPVGYQAGMNVYAYVGGEPVNRTDPYGNTCYERWHIRIWLNEHNVETRRESSFLGSFCIDDGSDVTDLGEIVVIGSRPTPVIPPQPRLIDQLRSLGRNIVCNSPSFTGGWGADAYAGLGVSVGFGVVADLKTGRFGLTTSLGAGVGVGINTGPQVGAGPNLGEGIVSANVGATVGGAAGVGLNAGASGTYNFLGTDPGFSGMALGRAGTPSAFANLTVSGGVTTPSLYDSGC